MRLSHDYDTTVQYINSIFHVSDERVFALCFLYTVQNLVGFHLHGYYIYNEEDYKLLCTSNAKLTCMIYLKNRPSFFVQSGSQIHKKQAKSKDPSP